ncbi:winged helix-turn-helix domain-containing protein [Serratia fonticola]|uniref:winged helix-turn-helix domain-containing protein n=1 Tax=Serratia fonticola TaxID=47917 RepID=UPI003AAB2282
MLRYLINNDVTFDPESNVLHSKNNKKTVSMLNPSGQCLLILLENKGNIVSKKEIYEFVWERYGLTATDNAFYQTVLYLRKNLKEAGLLSEIVKTVPRKGVLVPSSIQVEKIAPQQESIVDDSEVDFVIDPPHQHHDDEASHLTSSTQVDPLAETITTVSIEKTQPATDANAVNKARKYPFYLLPLLIVAALAVSMITAYWLESEETADYFSNYTNIAQLGTCSIFTDANKTFSDEYKYYIASIPINCSKTPSIYFTKIEFVKRISLIACTEDMPKGKKRNECTSYYIIIK